MNDASASLLAAGFRIRRASAIWVLHDVPSEEWLEACIEEITLGREVLPLAALARAPDRRKVTAITFDDGFRSVGDIAHPLLVRLGLTYTVFVSTHVLSGGPVPWFVRLHHLLDCVGIAPIAQAFPFHPPIGSEAEAAAALKQLPIGVAEERLSRLEEEHSVSPPDPHSLFLSAREVQAMAADGVTIGSHSHRHPILSTLTPQEQRFEIEKSADVIEGLTGERPVGFAYPNGSRLDFTQTTVELLQRAGYRFATTTTQRYLRRNEDPFRLPRIGLDPGHSVLHRVAKALMPTISRSHRREGRVRSRLRSVETESRDPLRSLS